MSVTDQIKEILISILQIKDSGANFAMDMPLLGAIPEFDSMAVVSIITAFEERFGFAVDDDEIDASVFETFGSLVAFVENKL